MPEGAYAQKKTSPTALAIVVLMHGAAIAALAMSKIDVIKKTFDPTVVVDIKNPPPPPPPDKPVEKVKQVPTSPPIYAPPPPFIAPLDRPAVTTTEIVQQYPPLDRGPVVEVDPPPPLPDPVPEPARKVEPARARANLASYVSDSDYPASAARNEEQGTTRFRLAVGADGRVKDCTVTGSSGSSALDSATCRIMKSRARFTPARDSDGKATGDSVSNSIRWVLPE
jgi:protein TonB